MVMDLSEVRGRIRVLQEILALQDSGKKIFNFAFCGQDQLEKAGNFLVPSPISEVIRLRRQAAFEIRPGG